LIGYLFFPLIERTKILYQLYLDSKINLKPPPPVEPPAEGLNNFGFGLFMGVGILGAIALFAKKANVL